MMATRRSLRNERYGFFKEKTTCVVDELQASGMILKIDSSRDLDSVYEDFVLAIKDGVDANYFERYGTCLSSETIANWFSLSTRTRTSLWEKSLD